MISLNFAADVENCQAAAGDPVAGRILQPFETTCSVPSCPTVVIRRPGVRGSPGLM